MSCAGVQLFLLLVDKRDFIDKNYFISMENYEKIELCNNEQENSFEQECEEEKD